MSAQSPANASVWSGIDQELPERVQSLISLLLGAVNRVFASARPCQLLAGAGRQLRFYIDPERSQNMPDAKNFLGSSPDAIDMYAAQFLA